MRAGLGFLNNSFFHVFIIVAVCFLCYLNSLTGEFLWDDESLVVNNSALTELSNVPSFFAPNAWPSDSPSSFYRPVQLISFAIDYYFWQLDSFGYHLHNVLFHVFNAILIYFLLLLLRISRFSGFVVSLFFGVHPLFTEAVSYVSGRADIQVLFFILLFFIGFIKSIGNSDFNFDLKASKFNLNYLFWALFSILCFSCACLSKEVALISPIAALVWYVIFIRKLNLKAVLFFVCLTGVIVGYYFIRLNSFPEVRFNIYDFSFIQRCTVGVKAFALYFFKIVFPFALHMEWYLPPAESVFEVQFLLAVVFLLLVIVLAITSFRKFKLIFFGIAWAIVFLLPVLNLLPLNATFSEHWVYVPMFGCLLSLGVVLSQPFKFKKIIYIILFVWIGLFSFLTVQRNYDWGDPIRFYEQTIKYSPNNIKIRYNLGNEYFKRNLIDNAFSEYIKVESILKNGELITRGRGANQILNGFLPKLYNNIGTCFVRKNDFKRAFFYYKKALEVNPKHFSALINLKKLYELMGGSGFSERFNRDAISV